MTFISHAQNREDVMLWRALGSVVQGFYVDVGANHPSHDSVTRAFYERGWSGINIEPLQEHFEELCLDRPRDINLQVAAGAQEGEVDLYDSEVRGLATASAEVAQARLDAGGDVRVCRVPVRRLDAILAEHVQGQIHFLKIDVEGFEDAVLSGLDLERWRPWVVVVEATKPNSQEQELGWEPKLTGARYNCVWFDGLNRYYLAHERMELARHFGSPPSVFDGYVPAEQERLRLALEAAQAELDAYTKSFKELSLRSAHQQREIEGMLNSRSWLITRPLREGTTWLKAIARRVIAIMPARLQAMAPSRARSMPVLGYWHEASYPRRAIAPALISPQGHTSGSHWWRVTGHVEGHYSLAEVNRSLALELDSLSQGRLQFVPWHGKRYMPEPDQSTTQSGALTGMMRRTVPQGERVISLVHHYPPMRDEEPADLRLALFFWEESLVPQDIISLLNEGTDGVLVASQFVRRALRHSGLDRPVFVMPMGLPVTPPRAPSVAGQKPFRYLHVSSAFERKGVDVLLEAFGRAFTGSDSVELYIKTFANPHHDIRGQVKAWRSRLQAPPSVVIDTHELNDGQMDLLYQSADAMVLPSRGEGFGLPAARALAMGTPLITTAGSGQADFASIGFADLLPYQCASSRSHVNQGEAYWQEPDAGALAQKLVSVRDASLRADPAQIARLERAAQWMIPHYRWDQAALSVQSFAQQLLDAPAVPERKKRLAVISPWNTACGIAEYAHALFKGWDESFDVRVYCDDRTSPNPAQQVYVPRWRVAQQDGLLGVLQELCEQASGGDLDVVFVQHQQSLFLLSDEVCEGLRKIRQLGVQVILELHSTLPMVREGRLGRRAVQALRDLDLVIVHKVEDVNYMLGVGLSDNVMCLPHSVVALDAPAPKSARAALGISEDDLVLGCFGFLWPHKGVDTVIRAMPLTSKLTGKRVKLLAVNAVVDKASQQMLRTCKGLAESLGVAADIVWVTDFLPIQEAMHTLSLADVQIFAYGPTRESASGAVTMGLATHRPVLVSDEGIFSELSGCTYQLKGLRPKHIAQAVQERVMHPHEGSQVHVAQLAWLESRSWSRASQRLRSTLSGLAVDRRLGQAFDLEQDNRVKQLLVDVTQIVVKDTGTGIQRVVRNILRHWQDSPPSGYAVCPVRFDATAGGYCHERGYLAKNPSQQSTAHSVERVCVDAGDVFVGLDLTAHLFPQVESMLASWRLAGVRVCFVVYDIIPLLLPGQAYPGTPQAFDVWVRSLRRQSDRVVCISSAVADDLRHWWSRNTEEGALPEVSHFHLGADFESEATLTHSSMSHDVQRAIASGAVLMVGTVEPRKGYSLALDAFDRLWAEGRDVSLVIVGGQGWDTEELCQRIRSHPRLGQHLFWFEGLDDAGLAHLYANAKGLLMASEAEGFGLPLIEAAHYGLPLLVRDIPVFREIAGPHASYVSEGVSQLLAFRLAAWLDEVSQGAAPSSGSMPRLDWRSSARRLLEEVL